MPEHQQVVLRNLMRTASNGKLNLCFDASELPLPIGPLSDNIQVTVPSQLKNLRNKTEELAKAHRLAADRCFDLVSSADEAATNAIVHAGGCVATLCSNDDTIQVRVEDRGNGIDFELLPLATMEPGFSTKDSLGYGFKMVLAMTDRTWLLTGAGGTTVVMEQDRVAGSKVDSIDSFG